MVKVWQAMNSVIFMHHWRGMESGGVNARESKIHTCIYVAAVWVRVRV